MGSFVYDAIIAVVLALFVWLGWRKGLLLSLCGLAAAVAAFLGAGFLADTLDAPVANAMVPKLETAIEEHIASRYDGPDVAGAIDALKEENGLFRWAADAVESAAEGTQGIPNISKVVSTAAEYIAQRLAHSLVFAVAFLALYVLLIFLLHALDLVAKLPGLHFCNGLGGGVIGLVKGALVVLVATAVLMSSSLQPDEAVVENSFLLKFLVENNPILSFL